MNKEVNYDCGCVALWVEFVHPSARDKPAGWITIQSCEEHEDGTSESSDWFFIGRQPEDKQYSEEKVNKDAM